jgi:hypothetical protein
MEWIIGLIILALYIWAIFNIWNSSAETVHKVLWTAAILVFQIFGFIAWFFLGPKAKA